MLKIVIPLAGSSELFSNAGYVYPKPLIEINGIPMIQLVMERVFPVPIPHQFIFLIKEEHAVKFHLDNTLKLLSPNSEVVKIKRQTRGGLCSVLMAIEKINDEDSMLVLNGDQIIEADFNTIYDRWQEKNADAGVVTFRSVHPRWSYARVEDEKVVQTAEKNPISANAIAGYYYFKNAKTFFDCAFQTIKNDVQFEGNFYISPVMNEYVLRNKTVFNYNVEPGKYHSFYSPQLVLEFEKKDNSLTEA